MYTHDTVVNPAGWIQIDNQSWIQAVVRADRLNYPSACVVVVVVGVRASFVVVVVVVA